MSAAVRAMQAAPALWIQRLPMRHRWLRWAVLGASLAFSAGSTYFFYLKIQDEARSRFAKSAISVAREVDSRIRSNEDVLHAMRGLFDAADQVTREDFHEFAQALALPKRYPGITNINFAMRVSGSQKQEFERAVRAEKSRLTEGLPEFSIKPPGERPEYIVLHYIEPLARSAIVWGNDLNSDPQRRAALQRARDTGQIASTSGITLESDTKSRVTSLLFRFAVYHGRGVPNTLEDRQRLYRGVVGSTIRIGEMIESALTRETRARVRVVIHEGGAPTDGRTSATGALLYDSEARSSTPVATDYSRYAVTQHLSFADRTWQLDIVPLVDPVNPLNHAAVAAVLAVSLAASVLLFWLLTSVVTSGSRGAELALTNEALQVENAERKRAEEKLLQKERLLSESQRLGHIGSWLFDMKGPISWSEETYSLYGVSPDTFIPTPESLLSLLHPDDRPAMQAWIAACAAGEKPADLEYRLSMPDGTIRFMRGSGEALHTAEHEFIHMAGTVQDITERKLLDLEREKFVALLENSPDFIGMATLEGKPFYVNTPGRDLVGLDRDIDVSSTNISEYFDGETAVLLENTAIPATFATGGWTGEGSLRHFKTHALIPVHIHSILVKDAKTGEPICIATIERDISEIKDAEMKLEKANRELLHVSRLAGMAEIATGVLHNVGNVLNSVNVSADRIAEKVRRLSPASLVKVAAMLREHAHDLPDFLTRDPQGKELPGYLSALVGQLAEPQKDILPEVVALRKNVEHIREIVRTQQAYAGVQGVLETVPLTDLVEDAIRIHNAAFTRHEVQVIREYSPVPSFPMEKHKVLQILVNLLGNAKSALDKQPDSKVTVRVETNGNGTAKVSVTDNGVGIAPENLTQIFQHGFTTRKDGHGFGLHSGALAAKEMGGSLTGWSAGPGKGAVFTLELLSPALKKAA